MNILYSPFYYKMCFRHIFNGSIKRVREIKPIAYSLNTRHDKFRALYTSARKDLIPNVTKTVLSTNFKNIKVARGLHISSREMNSTEGKSNVRNQLDDQKNRAQNFDEFVEEYFEGPIPNYFSEKERERALRNLKRYYDELVKAGIAPPVFYDTTFKNRCKSILDSAIEHKNRTTEIIMKIVMDPYGCYYKNDINRIYNELKEFYWNNYGILLFFGGFNLGSHVTIYYPQKKVELIH